MLFDFLKPKDEPVVEPKEEPLTPQPMYGIYHFEEEPKMCIVCNFRFAYDDGYCHICDKPLNWTTDIR